jgi:hypothetical protein
MPVQGVFAAVNIATTVMQLFGPKGYSIGNLLTIQTEMLRTISAQLDVLQKGIEVIIGRLEEIQRLIGELPKETASQIYQTELKGLLGTYQEIMTGFILECETDGGVLSAQKRYKNVIEEELLKQLRNTRSELFSFNDPLHIPLISAALNIEVQAMTIADYHKEQRPRLIAALKRYMSWLENLLSKDYEQSIPNRIKIIKEKQLQIVDTSQELRVYRLCKLRESEEWGRYHRYYDIYIDCSVHSYSKVPVLDSDQMEQVKPLIDSNYFLFENTPHKLEVFRDRESSFQIKVREIKLYERGDRGGRDLLSTRYESDNHSFFQNDAYSFNNASVIVSCDGSVGVWTAPPESLQQTSSALELTGYSIVSLGALQATAVETLNALKRFLKELQ